MVVVSMSAEEQMIGIDTNGIIAVVTDARAGGYRAVMMLPTTADALFLVF